MNDEQQRLLLKSCGDVFMFYIIDWNTYLSYLEVKCHGTVIRAPTVASADEAYCRLCDMEGSKK